MKHLIRLVALLVVAACKQNPYPESGRLVQREPVKPAPQFPPLLMDVPNTVKVMEGQNLELPLLVKVPAPGKPIVTVTGLPKGAVFSPSSMTITWTPTYQDANDDKDISVVVREYPIQLKLASSENPVVVSQHETTILVQDVPRPINVYVPDLPISLTEGENFEQIFEVSCEDFPQGPFDILIKNLPPSASIERDLSRPNRFKVLYTPSFRDALLAEARSSVEPYVDRPLEVNVFGPRGTVVTKPMVWRVHDVRGKAIVMAPTQITQGTSVSFTVTAEDPNGEEPPTLILAPRPTFGVSELTVETKNPGDRARGVNPSAIASFQWTQIPVEKMGTTQDVSIQACVRRNLWADDLCTQHIVKVKFELEVHAPPVIDRRAFAAGEVRYLREREKLNIPMHIFEPEFANTPEVEILPKSDGINWAKGVLHIEGKKSGLKAFSLKATSVFGVTHEESFLVEVLPWSWNKVLLLGDTPRDPEVKASLALFGDGAQLANPALQLGDPRLLVLRDAVYVSTGAFAEPGVIAPMERQAGLVPVVLLSTPLVSKLEGGLKTEMNSLGVTTRNRLTDLVGYSLEMAPGSDWLPPSDPIKLQGSLTSESSQPTPLSLAKSSSCKPVLVLKKASEEDLPVAALCKRRKGGLLLIAGIELADIQTSPTDSGIVKRWLSTLVAK